MQTFGQFPHQSRLMAPAQRGIIANLVTMGPLEVSGQPSHPVPLLLAPAVDVDLEDEVPARVVFVEVVVGVLQRPQQPSQGFWPVNVKIGNVQNRATI